MSGINTGQLAAAALLPTVAGGAQLTSAGRGTWPGHWPNLCWSVYLQG